MRLRVKVSIVSRTCLLLQQSPHGRYWLRCTYWRMVGSTRTLGCRQRAIWCTSHSELPSVLAPTFAHRRSSGAHLRHHCSLFGWIVTWWLPHIIRFQAESVGGIFVFTAKLRHEGFPPLLLRQQWHRGLPLQIR